MCSINISYLLDRLWQSHSKRPPLLLMPSVLSSQPLVPPFHAHMAVSGEATQAGHLSSKGWLALLESIQSRIKLPAIFEIISSGVL